MQTAKLVVAALSMTLAGALPQPARAVGPDGGQIHVHASPLQVAATAAPAKVDATKATLRNLWIEHIFWVRNVVLAELAGNTAAQQAAEQQVVADAKAIAASIEPFYGAPAKDKLFTLLVGHYGAVKAYLDASIAKDTAKQDDATAKLLSNASDIATFLSGANPYLPKSTLDELLQAHGGHHIAEIQQLLAKDYVGEAQTWADMSQHMYVIADALGDALAMQFPTKFLAAK
jgi:hypothetical protein